MTVTPQTGENLRSIFGFVMAISKSRKNFQQLSEDFGGVCRKGCIAIRDRTGPAPHKIMLRETAMATVFVWENHFIARHAGDHTWTGHSSLSINDRFVDTRALVQDDNDPTKMVVDGGSTDLVSGSDDFVSYWPGKLDSAGPKNANGNFTQDAWKIGVSFMAAAKPSIFADIALEGYAPDHVVRVDKLKVNKMVAKWRTIRSKPNAHYKLLRKNCSTIVAHVMHAGSPWYNNDHYMMWTPTNVRD